MTETDPQLLRLAEAVLFAAKDGRFLENPFLAITTLPPFSSFPPSPRSGKVLSAGEPGTMVSTGGAGVLRGAMHRAWPARHAYRDLNGDGLRGLVELARRVL